MNLQEIKQAIENGIEVYWSNKAYRVLKTYNKSLNETDYNIVCDNGHCIGLTWMDGITMNGKESEFFTDEEINLLENWDLIPYDVQDILNKYAECDNTYQNCELLVNELKQVGYSIDYGLDAEPYNLKRIDNTFSV